MAASSASFLTRLDSTLEQYSALLYVAPLPVAVLSLAAALGATLVLSLDEAADCVDLRTFLGGAAVLAYAVLLLYAMLIIGPDWARVSRLGVFGVEAALALLSFIWYVLGTGWLGSQCSAENDAVRYTAYVLVGGYWASMGGVALWLLAHRVSVAVAKRHEAQAATPAAAAAAGDGDDAGAAVGSTAVARQGGEA